MCGQDSQNWVPSALCLKGLCSRIAAVSELMQRATLCNIWWRMPCRPARQLPARASPGEAAVVEYVPGPNNRPLGIVHAHVGLVNAIVAGLPATWGGLEAAPPQMLLHSDLTSVGAMPAPHYTQAF